MRSILRVLRFLSPFLYFLAGLNPVGTCAADISPLNDIPQSVEIRGLNGVMDERQRATSSKSIVSREDIIRYGDSNLSDLLKRLPGITISHSSARGIEVQMRGLGTGYTQILLDGEVTASGFSLDSIAPELIERIEVLRTATAEYSNQAIAGTINIVLKKTVSTALREIKFALTESHGQLAPTISMQLSDRKGSFSYTLATALQRQLRTSTELFDESGFDQAGQLTLQRHTVMQERMTRDELSFAPRLIWQLANEDTLMSQNFMSNSHITDTKERQETSALNTPSQFPLNRSNWDAYTNTLRSDLNWLRKLQDSTRLDIKFGVNAIHRDTNFDFDGMSTEKKLLERHQVRSGIQDQALTLSGKYSAPFFEHHALLLGWDGSLIQRAEDRIERQSDALGSTTATSNEDYHASIKRLALFAQDEWDISRRWSASLGVRWEGLQTTTSGNVLSQVNNRSTVVSPLLQTVWKLSEVENAQQQLRLALTRTYKAPTTTSLIPRRYTVDNNNSATNPDTQGNPQLRPELAWGLDAAFERYFGSGGLMSASAYLRRIDDVILDHLSLQEGTWINTPANSGQAHVRGLELELKMPLQSLLSNAPAIDLRASINRNWSRVEQVPGPDNRLDRQASLSANLALDYKIAVNMVVGSTLSYKRGDSTRTSTMLRSIASDYRELDCYAVWDVEKQTQWRLVLANLMPQDKLSRDSYQDQQSNGRLVTLVPGYRTLRLLLKHTF